MDELVGTRETFGQGFTRGLGVRYEMSKVVVMDTCKGICHGAWNMVCNEYAVMETFAQGLVREFSLR